MLYLHILVRNENGTSHHRCTPEMMYLHDFNLTLVISKLLAPLPVLQIRIFLLMNYMYMYDPGGLRRHAVRVLSIGNSLVHHLISTGPPISRSWSLSLKGRFTAQGQLLRHVSF